MTMTTGIASWDFDVPNEWFQIPLDEQLDARTWARAFAHEVSEYLEADGSVDLLVDGLAEVQTQLSRRRDPWLTALIAVRPESPMTVGAIVTAKQLERDADDSPLSIEQQMRRDAEQLEPGTRSRDLVLWRDSIDAGEYVGMTQKVEHVALGEESGELSERAIYVVFPPQSSDVVHFQFFTFDFGYFDDIRKDTELVLRTLRVELEAS